jgi:adenylyl-sulfate kinase
MNLYKHQHIITREDRNTILNQQSSVIWLTGLSGSGKSTIANDLAEKLHKNGNLAYILDGDNIRLGLNKDLGFSEEDRKENIRRISEVAKLMSDAGLIVITAFISPFIEERQKAKEIIGDGFCEVYVEASLDVCEERDPKGIYKRVRAGEIKNFTGISSPYEAPLAPDLNINTSDLSVTESSNKIINFMVEKSWITIKK